MEQFDKYSSDKKTPDSDSINDFDAVVTTLVIVPNPISQHCAITKNINIYQSIFGGWRIVIDY